MTQVKFWNGGRTDSQAMAGGGRGDYLLGSFPVSCFSLVNISSPLPPPHIIQAHFLWPLPPAWIVAAGSSVSKWQRSPGTLGGQLVTLARHQRPKWGGLGIPGGWWSASGPGLSPPVQGQLARTLVFCKRQQRGKAGWENLRACTRCFQGSYKYLVRLGFWTPVKDTEYHIFLCVRHPVYKRLLF